MKHVLKLILLAAALLLFGCSTSRKLEKNTDKVVADSVSENISKLTDACKVVDTTKTESGESIITEIIFFGDSARAPDLPELIIDNDGKMTIKGGKGVKSIKQTAIRSNVVKNGMTTEQEHHATTKDKATVHNEKKHNEVVKASRRSNVWTWAIAASIVAVLVLFMRYRKPILAWLRKLLASMRKDLE